MSYSDEARDCLKHNNFDLLRLFAATQVVLSHAAAHLEPRLQPYIAWLAYFPGVPIFFFISGFLISAAWERHPKLRTFAGNRFLRICPALWVAFFFSVAMLAVAYPEAFRLGGFLKVLLWAVAQLTLGQDWNPDFLRGFGVGALNGSLWTIPVEISFYVAIPILYWLSGRARSAPLVLGVVVLFSIAAQWGASLYVGQDSHTQQLIKLLNITPVPWIWMFAIGVLAQRFKNVLCPFVAGRFGAFLLLYVAVSLLAWYIPFYPFLAGDNNRLGILNFLFLALLVLAAAFSARNTSDRVLRRNDISYGVYIYHMPVINLLLAKNFGGVSGIFTALGATCGVALLSWFVVEKRALRLRVASLHKHG